MKKLIIIFALFYITVNAQDSTKLKDIRLEMRAYEKDYDVVEAKINELKDLQKKLIGVYEYLRLKEAEEIKRLDSLRIKLKDIK
jgi:hypothetical protein